MSENRNNLKALVWVLDSHYTGELHARIGLVEHLGLAYEIIPLPHDDVKGYQDMLREKYDALGQALPLVIISGTGEETTAEIADLRQVFGERLFAVYLASILPEQPHPRLSEYDLIASTQLTGHNIVTLLGVPHRLSHENLQAAGQKHADYFRTLPRPITAFLVGGNTRYCAGFTASHARQLARRIAPIIARQGGSLLITNSRRTPPTSLCVLLTELDNLNPRFFDWHNTPLDFYYAILAYTDLFIVTGDSLSMCSEAAFTGKPILVDLSKEATECFHREILGRLVDYGAAKPISNEFEYWTYEPIDPTHLAANAVKDRFQKKFS